MRFYLYIFFSFSCLFYSLFACRSVVTIFKGHTQNMFHFAVPHINVDCKRYTNFVRCVFFFLYVTLSICLAISPFTASAYFARRSFCLHAPFAVVCFHLWSDKCFWLVYRITGGSLVNSFKSFSNENDII